jgi:hypothetical protein
MTHVYLCDMLLALRSWYHSHSTLQTPPQQDLGGRPPNPLGYGLHMWVLDRRKTEGPTPKGAVAHHGHLITSRHCDHVHAFSVQLIPLVEGLELILHTHTNISFTYIYIYIYMYIHANEIIVFVFNHMNIFTHAYDELKTYLNYAGFNSILFC